MSQKQEVMPPVDDQPSASSGTAARHPDETGMWQPIETAPKDGTPILGWCVDGGEKEYFVDERTMTLYGAHTEGLSHVEDGPHVIVWGGGFDDRTWEDSNAAHLPDWWFRYGSEFEETANPTHWMPLPPPPPAVDASRSRSDHPDAIPGADANATQAE